MSARDADFEAHRDAPCTFYEFLSDACIEKIESGLLEELKPAIEMHGIDRQRQMHAHRLAMIDATGQHDGRPEATHPLQVRFPLMNPGIEDGSEQLVIANSRVKAAYELVDHGFVDASLLTHLLHDPSTAFGIGKIVCHCISLNVFTLSEYWAEWAQCNDLDQGMGGCRMPTPFASVRC